MVISSLVLQPDQEMCYFAYKTVPKPTGILTTKFPMNSWKSTDKRQNRSVEKHDFLHPGGT